jgi:Cu(I)/Ag(I) efflux system protein CusF
MKFSTMLIAAALSLPFSTPVMAQAGTAAAAASVTSGEIRKVDKEAGKLTIKHGPIANLEMGAMTMVFRVSDPAMLNAVKAGDKVNFVAERVNGAITVTKIDIAK